MLKKLLSILIAFGLIFTLAGCNSEKPTVNVAVQEILDKIDEEMEFPPMLEMEGDYLKEAYPFDEELVEEFIIKQAMINIRSDEIAIFKLKDKKDLAEIEKAIEERLDALNLTWGMYLPDQHEKVKNHVIEKKDQYLLFAITDDQEKVVEIFNSFFK